MFEDIAGTNGIRFLMAAGAVAAGLFVLVAILWIVRNRASSPFVRGGKNRQPRLAVLDAAAVDTRRRLVLVRRDEVEHLIMIGGPTDIVIESRIVGARPPVDPVPPQSAALPAPRTQIPAAPQAAPVAQRAPERPLEPRAALPPVSSMGQVLYGEETAAPKAAPAPAPRIPAPPVRAAATVERTPPQRPPAPVVVAGARTSDDSLDAVRGRVPVSPGSETKPQAPDVKRDDPRAFERLLDAEISGDLSRLTPNATARPAQTAPVGSNASAAPQRQEPSLEEEMNRMLNEMGPNRRS